MNRSQSANQRAVYEQKVVGLNNIIFSAFASQREESCHSSRAFKIRERKIINQNSTQETHVTTKSNLHEKSNLEYDADI
jgi:hypothetical protein